MELYDCIINCEKIILLKIPTPQLFEEKINSYLKENKKRRFETQLSFYRRAMDNSSVNYIEIIKLIIKNNNNKQLSKIDRNTVEELIKPLTIDPYNTYKMEKCARTKF